MYSFETHYENLLAKYYTRAFGGAEKNYQQNKKILEDFQIVRGQGKTAFDLGAGAGFFSIPLAQMGFSIHAIDLEPSLLGEIESSKENLEIETVRCDILSFHKHTNTGKIDLVVCTTDVISHLHSYDEMDDLFRKISLNLDINGRFLLSYRDQTNELTGEDRFIPFYSDDEIIMTTFAEFGEEHLDVTDIFHIHENGQWKMTASSYQKLRIYDHKVKHLLTQNQLTISNEMVRKGMTYLLCRQQRP